MRKTRRDALFKAFRSSFDKHRDAFNVSKELDKYIVPARCAVESGFQVVIYGHTHLVKRVDLGVSETTLPVYLNTGTWADLMRVPDSIWGSEEDGAKEALAAFIADLESNCLSEWRRSVPTYAKIELIKIDGKYSIQDADVYFADDNKRVTTTALMQKLAGGEQNA